VQLSIAILVFGLMADAACASQSQSKVEVMDIQITEQLEAFHGRKDAEVLKAVHRSLLAVHPDEQPDVVRRRQLRREKLNGLLQILAAIDREVDATFDPRKVPELSIAPPVVNGVVLDSGIDPKSIADPEVRRAYEDAIAANKQLAKTYAFQTELRRLDAAVTGSVAQVFREPYVTSAPGRTEVAAAIRVIIQDPLRQVRLLDLLNQP